MNNLTALLIAGLLGSDTLVHGTGLRCNVKDNG
ncbi:hypothetical protein RCH14_003413 [Massilia sp. MP_M2]